MVQVYNCKLNPRLNGPGTKDKIHAESTHFTDLMNGQSRDRREKYVNGLPTICLYSKDCSEALSSDYLLQIASWKSRSRAFI